MRKYKKKRKIPDLEKWYFDLALKPEVFDTKICSNEITKKDYTSKIYIPIRNNDVKKESRISQTKNREEFYLF